jgi:hypothetical protein
VRRPMPCVGRDRRLWEHRGPSEASEYEGLGGTGLDEGNKDGWFDSVLIVRLSLLAAIFLVLFVWIELKSANPAVNLRLLAGRNFGFGTLANVIVGFALYGTVYILPQYLGQMFGYNAEHRLRAGLDRPAAARDHSVRALADGASGCAPHRDEWALRPRGQLLHECLYVAGLRRLATSGAQYRAIGRGRPCCSRP